MDKNFKKVNFSIFSEAAETFGISSPELCENLGYSKSAFHLWQRERKMPKVAALAIEGLMRRNKKAIKKHSVVVKADNLELIGGGDGITIREIAENIWTIEI